MTNAFIRTCLRCALLLTATPTLASGYIPMPEVRQTLRSYRACLAQLQSAEAEDHLLIGREKAKTKAASSDGTTRVVSLEAQSKGVERVGRNHARYAARIWYRNGAPRPDLNQIEYSHSWESHSYECQGRVMITNTSQGYTLSTFEPLPTVPAK
jgi:hypothetical protein